MSEPRRSAVQADDPEGGRWYDPIEMHSSLHIRQTIGMIWFFSCVGAFLVIHAWLVSRLEAWGVAVPMLAWNTPWVEWKYVEVCRERKMNPWRPIRLMIACWLLALAGMVFVVMSS